MKLEIDVSAYNAKNIIYSANFEYRVENSKAQVKFYIKN